MGQCVCFEFCIYQEKVEIEGSQSEASDLKIKVSDVLVCSLMLHVSIDVCSLPCVHVIEKRYDLVQLFGRARGDRNR
jgi:hypothetical protein